MTAFTERFVSRFCENFGKEVTLRCVDIKPKVSSQGPNQRTPGEKNAEVNCESKFDCGIKDCDPRKLL